MEEMKRLITGVLICMVLFSCSDDKKQEKVLLDSVIKIHDHVMGNDDRLMKNKMKLDTLLKTKLTQPGDTAAVKAKLLGLKVQLNNAEDGMEKWMQKFDPEMKGKSHEEIINYLEVQKAQVIAIDSSVNNAVNASSNYLNQLKKP